MKRYGLDTETNAEWGKKDALRCIQIYNPEKNWTSVFYRHAPDVGFLRYKVIHTPGEVCAEPTVENLCKAGERIPNEQMKVMLGNSQVEFICHNALFDNYILLRDLGIYPKLAGDSYILGQLLPQGPEVSRSLDNQMKLRVDKSYDKYKWGKWEDYDWNIEVPSEFMIKYAASDAMAGYILEAAIRVQFPKYANLIYQIEMQLVEVLCYARLHGLRIHEAQFLEELTVTEKDLKAQVDELCKIRGSEVKIGSPRNMAEWLFIERKNVPQLKTEKGAPSTSEEALLLLDDPIVDKILAAKENQAVFSSLRALNEKKIHEVVVSDKGTLRLYHPEFKPLADSQGGRIYSTDPSANSWNWRLRGCVVPSPGAEFYLCDVSAFELMVLAYAADEKKLIEVYLSGEDIHINIASEIFDTPRENVSEEQREAAKTVEYAVIFGSEGHSVARKLRIPMKEAKDLVSLLKSKYPKIAVLESFIHQRVEKSGLSITPFGRYRKISEAFNKMLIPKARRKAMNTFAQSGAADIAKAAMVTMHRTLPKGTRLVFTVFDSFLIEKPLEMANRDIDVVVREALTVNTEKGVWKFLFKSGSGPNWKAAKEAMKTPMP